MNTQTSYFQDAIETVEKLPPDDQILLVEIIRQRLIEKRRMELITHVAETRQAYQSGDVQRGTVDDLMITVSCLSLPGIKTRVKRKFSY